MNDLPDPTVTNGDLIEVSGPSDGVVNVEGRGELDATAFATALASTAGPGVATVVLDLSAVTYFSMEAAAALLTHRLNYTFTGQVVLLPSAVVARKLALLGMGGMFPTAPQFADGMLE